MCMDVKGQFRESALFFYHMGWKHRIQVIRFCDKCPHLLSHLAIPTSSVLSQKFGGDLLHSPKFDIARWHTEKGYKGGSFMQNRS